ncbi:GNAT family N-acetyltransferase [Umezawaea endophytica]|uniref:GNAT family N-acetyltransferase n=1 Tax=Umezawaea endophytica TaxID=1654476 RepID=A0A9X2VMS1_9PSEU|nr:GNAT family N-acetyltransferase [Umezawaea endophytica]MCS7479455.1 GNAT family N-acetyltransferase [Umezawaea endophytica]
MDLRPAEPRDLDQIGALLTERGEPEDALDHRLVVQDPDEGWSSCAVVVDGDRIVSTLTLLDETLVLGGVRIPAGQVELVATDREYEGRGLVRRLMAWAHQRSTDLGHLAQVMIGIPYFYRRFGYAYAIPIPPTRKVVLAPPPVAGHVVRRAGPADIAAMAAVQDGLQAELDLRMPHSPACWRWLVAREGSTQWVVERDGAVVAVGRLTDSHLTELAGVDAAAEQALLNHVVGLVEGVEVTDRLGNRLGRFLGPLPEDAEMYYARLPDTAAVLDRLRPLLSRRAAGYDGEVVVSFFGSHVRFHCANGEAGPMTTGGPMQGPASVGGAGVAPDLVPSLLFGPHGIEGLARLHPDVYPGPNRKLMAALFPPVRADLLTYYVP